MIIDSHNHPDWHGHDLNRYLANMEKYHIDRTWILSWECPEDERSPEYNYTVPEAGERGAIPFSRCLSYVERAPEKFTLGYAPDPRKPEAIDRLRAGVEIYGVKVYGELKLRMMYDNPDAIRMFRFCGEKELPVVVHIDYEMESESRYPRPSYWYGGGMEAFERAVKACPDTIFLGHAPGFWVHISNDKLFKTEFYPKESVVPGGKIISMLKRYPNLYCDLSAGSGINALKRDPEFAKGFLLEFQDRILYGRDQFDNVHQEFLDSLELPDDVSEKIYYKNSLKLVPDQSG
jgi:predicted TIM-barrel fold metal-dependent hydrolase